MVTDFLPVNSLEGAVVEWCQCTQLDQEEVFLHETNH